jgi:hypothetical protein
MKTLSVTILLVLTMALLGSTLTTSSAPKSSVPLLERDRSPIDLALSADGAAPRSWPEAVPQSDRYGDLHAM